MTLDGDRELTGMVDAALAEAVRKCGPWLACRPGCTPCCMGVFAISAPDAHRLRSGLAELEACDPDRAARVRHRARASVERLSKGFPGDPATGILSGDEAAFDEFANDEPCPALDPATGLCDLYSARPMTCRIFGPPFRTPDAEVGVCELCFAGASDDDIAACSVDLDIACEKAELSARLNRPGDTIVAFCLTGESR